MDNLDQHTICQALGAEIRLAREDQSLTRDDVVARMTADLSSQSIANYEYGIRQCTVTRFVEVCRAMRVSAVEVLALCLQRAEIDPYTRDIRVDLHALADSTDHRLGPIPVWAARTLKRERDEGRGVATIEYAVIEQWAVMLEMTTGDLAKALLVFTPGAAPPDAYPTRSARRT